MLKEPIKNDGQAKRFAFFRVYEILSEYTDENHHLTHADIIKKLEDLFGLHVERKLVREKIDDINEIGEKYGIEVSSKKGDGAYLLGRVFEKSEISFLIDAVFSSKSIGQKQAQELTKKLQSFLSVYDRKSFNYVAKSSEVNRTDNKTVFYNIDVLLEAIGKGKKIAFNYNRFYIDSKKNEYKKNRRLIASPYYLVNNQGKYYLVCNNNYFDDISNYRVERMGNIEVLDEDVKPLNTIKNCENFDIVKYANENIYMFSTSTVDAKIRIDNEYSVSYVQDWFGNNSKIYQNDRGEVFADVRTNEIALIFWCLQYGENIELIEPKETRAKIRHIVDKMYKNYNTEDKK